MTVAAVVPHWNRRELLDELLPSLGAQTARFDEIIVVDNGSTDGSAEHAGRSGAKVVALPSNLGFAAAVNRGIDAARSDWVAILNNDVTLDPLWLETLLASSEGNSFVTGKILRASEPSIIDGTFDGISRGACACRCGAGKPDAAMWNQPRKIQFASMTAGLFRRDLFEEIGRLDEGFGSYMEDVEFGLRAALAGRTGAYVPGAIAYHRGSSTLGAWTSDTVGLISRNQILLARKHFQGQPRWPMVAGQLLWGLLALRHAKGFSWLRGKISGLTSELRPTLSVGSTPSGESSEKQNRIRDIIESSEKEIFALAQQAGFDRYWRAYFWLLRR